MTTSTVLHCWDLHIVYAAQQIVGRIKFHCNFNVNILFITYWKVMIVFLFSRKQLFFLHTCYRCKINNILFFLFNWPNSKIIAQTQCCSFISWRICNWYPVLWPCSSHHAWTAGLWSARYQHRGQRWDLATLPDDPTSRRRPCRHPDGTDHQQCRHCESLL